VPYTRPNWSQESRAILHHRHLLPGAIIFAGIAGYVNSVALGSFHSPVSHMTGAISYLGIDLTRGLFYDSLLTLGILGGFVGGAGLSGLIVGSRGTLLGRRHGVCLLLESGCLALAMLMLLHNRQFGLVAAAGACGLQNAMTSSYCGLAIRTTHVTGTVTDIGVMLGHWIRYRRVEGWKLGFMVIVVAAFASGVALGATVNAQFGPIGLILPSFGTFAAGALVFSEGFRRWVSR
jgi:uncharacterized membrane protein YoaK (UPF0700 family)